MDILDGRKIKEEILTEVKKEIISLPFQPVFCDVLVGGDPSSVQYVKMKAKTAESLGIKFYNASFLSDIKTEDLIKEIKILNKIQNMCGIIVQLPLPKTLDRKKILDAINPNLDVDCLGTKASEKFYRGFTSVYPPAAVACMKLLDSSGISLEDKEILVLGQGNLVGKPVSYLLNSRGLSHNIITNQSENKKELIKKADIIISGIGKGKYITGDMIKKGVILIDAGTSESEGSVVGDVDFESVKNVAGFLSPVPGGVGPVTVAMLFKNVLKVAKNK